MSQTLSTRACAFECGLQLKQLAIECEWVSRDSQQPLSDADSFMFHDCDIGSPFIPVSQNSEAAHEVERRRTQLEQLALKACAMLQDLKIEGESSVDEHAPILKLIEAAISRWRKLERVRFRNKSLCQIMLATKNAVPVHCSDRLLFEENDWEKNPQILGDSYKRWQKTQLDEIEYCRESTVEALKALEQFCAVKTEKLPQPIRDLILLGEQFQTLEQEAYLEDQDCPDFKEKLRKTIRFLLEPIPSLQATKICQELAGGSCIELLAKAKCLIAKALETKEYPKKPVSGAGNDFPELTVPEYFHDESGKDKIEFEKRLNLAAEKPITLCYVQIDFKKHPQLKKLLLLLLNTESVGEYLFEDCLYNGNDEPDHKAKEKKIKSAFRKAVCSLKDLLEGELGTLAPKIERKDVGYSIIF